MKKEIIKKVLSNTLVNILAIVVAIIALTFIALLCWNHIAAVFSLCKLHYIDIFCMFTIIYCVCTVINLGIRNEL